MIAEYYEVNEVTGEIINVHILDSEVDIIPSNYVLGWGSDSGLHRPVYDFSIGQWVESKTQDEFLKEAKEAKCIELSVLCKANILGRFTVTIDGMQYQFSCDQEAQMNFEKVDRAFEKGRSVEEPWTAYTIEGEVVRLTLTPELFEPVYVAHLEHIRENIVRFRDELQPQVESATTIEELNNVVW